MRSHGGRQDHFGGLGMAPLDGSKVPGDGGAHTVSFLELNEYLAAEGLQETLSELT